MHRGARGPAARGIRLSRRHVGRGLLGVLGLVAVLGSPNGARGDGATTRQGTRKRARKGTPKRDRGHDRAKGRDHGRGDDGSSRSLDAEELALLGLLNDYRGANGLLPLTSNAQLCAAADAHAADMATNNFTGHIGSAGSDPSQRIQQAGYDYEWCGENLFWGDAAAGVALAWWKGSPSHHENLLFAPFTEMGISRVWTAGSTYGWYWATTFGSRRPG
jgi:uncharacterized protein YkwD